MKVYHYEAQQFVSYALPHSWERFVIEATRYEIDDLGHLHFFINDDPVASFAPGHWQRVMENKPRNTERQKE